MTSVRLDHDDVNATWTWSWASEDVEFVTAMSDQAFKCLVIQLVKSALLGVGGEMLCDVEDDEE